METQNAIKKEILLKKPSRYLLEYKYVYSLFTIGMHTTSSELNSWLTQNERIDVVVNFEDFVIFVLNYIRRDSNKDTFYIKDKDLFRAAEQTQEMLNFFNTHKNNFCTDKFNAKKFITHMERLNGDDYIRLLQSVSKVYIAFMRSIIAVQIKIVEFTNIYQGYIPCRVIPYIGDILELMHYPYETRLKYEKSTTSFYMDRSDSYRNVLIHKAITAGVAVPLLTDLTNAIVACNLKVLDIPRDNVDALLDGSRSNSQLETVDDYKKSGLYLLDGKEQRTEYWAVIGAVLSEDDDTDITVRTGFTKAVLTYIENHYTIGAYMKFTAEMDDYIADLMLLVNVINYGLFKPENMHFIAQYKLADL